ncbi:MAG: type II toxin-antitoxin system HicB family antitoxin [Deltaproteobacteria bacterium]|nr:MAG: type II toxin-antitoxin system HicB family antitoxin [Deltaproteobacteria bacterium]
MEFLVKIHKSKYGYDVHCPLLPGCASQGETEAEAIENIKDAIKEYLFAVKQVKKNEELRKVEVAI